MRTKPSMTPCHLGWQEKGPVDRLGRYYLNLRRAGPARQLNKNMKTKIIKNITKKSLKYTLTLKFLTNSLKSKKI